MVFSALSPTFTGFFVCVWMGRFDKRMEQSTMTIETINNLFYLLSFSPGPFWLCLVAFPKNKWAMVAFDVLLFLLSLIFTIIAIPEILYLAPIIASPTFEAINGYLGTPLGTLGSWNHMILGDLWIGRWVVHDAIKNQVSILLRLPFIGLILFFGPVGLFFYLCYRMILLKQFQIADGY